MRFKRTESPGDTTALPTSKQPGTGSYTVDEGPGKKAGKVAAVDAKQIKLDPLSHALDSNPRIARAQSELQKATAALKAKLHRYAADHPDMAQKSPW